LRYNIPFFNQALWRLLIERTRGVAMPIYEYRCSSCGHELEALQKFSDAPMSECPSCHAATLVKLLSAAGFKLKGSGWYATDFKGSGSKPAPAKADAAAKSESGAGSNGGAKGESKGETTTGAKSGTGSETPGSTPAPAAKTGAPPVAT
jgi:putative FmdB family regulatory protein